ncbi:MAG: RNA polymerase sigma factor [Candidatus Binatia bacterium]
MATDEDLIGAVATGDGRALDELCRRYERPLYQFLFRHTGGRDAEDLYQETWLRIVRAADRFDPARRFSTWLFQIALNLCRDWRRRPPPEAVDPGTIDAPATGPGTADATEAALDASRLLAALPEAQRSAVILRYYHDLSEEEVAEILGCPRGTVKSRLHYAMDRLLELAREPATPMQPPSGRSAPAPDSPGSASAPPGRSS